MDYLVFPRLAALAEVGWSRPEQKNWDLFLKAMDRYNEHLDVKGIGYARSMYNIQHTSTPVDGALQIKLECIRPDVEIRYTTDGSEPEATSTLYTRAVGIPYCADTEVRHFRPPAARWERLSYYRCYTTRLLPNRYSLKELPEHLF